MKYIKGFILIIFTCFFLNIKVLAASSNFDITINMQPDITENQVKVYVGFTGEEIMAVTHNLSYDSSKLTLVDVEALDNFVVTTGGETTDGKWKIIPILADSDYSFVDSNFAVLTFEVSESFKIDKTSDVFIYNVEASGPDKTKYRTQGEIMTMDRESASEMYFLTKDIDNSTNIKYWISEHLLLIALIILGIIGVVVLIIMLPSKRKKEHRDSIVNDQLKKENYSGTPTVKINQTAIDSIGEVAKPIDMKDAIIVDETVKPFGDIVGRYDNTVNNSENLGNINLNNNVQNQEVVNNVIENSQVVDAFNTKPMIDNNNLDDGFIELLDDNNENTINKPPQNSNDELTLFQPQAFEDVSQTQNNNNSNNNGNLFSIILLLALSLTLFNTANIKAEETIYRIDDLRDCIVGNIPFDKELDYNKDGKVDVLDLIYTKDLTNCNFEELLQTDPGFAELHGQSNNLISSSKEWTTTKKGNKTKKTTTKKVTTKKNTTAKKTTTKRVTTKKSTTAKKTTTKKTTTKKSTTTKTTTTKAVYNVNIMGQNGVPATSSISVTSGKSGTVVVTPNVGYEFSSVDCGSTAKGSFSKSTNKLTVKSVTANSTCTVTFKLKSIKVSIVATKGSASPSSLTGTYGTSATATVKPNTGYEYKMISCTNNVNATYDSSTNIFKVLKFDNAGSCTVTFQAKKFTLSVIDSNGYTLESVTESYGNSVTITVISDLIYTKLRCNELQRTFTKNNISDTLIEYEFKHTIKENTTCTFS